MRDLDDGSWLALLQKSTDRKSEPTLVRAVDYTVDDGRGNDTSYRLFTTLLEPARPPPLTSPPPSTGDGRSRS